MKRPKEKNLHELASSQNGSNRVGKGRVWVVNQKMIRQWHHRASKT